MQLNEEFSSLIGNFLLIEAHPPLLIDIVQGD